MIIDVHAHGLHEDFLRSMAANPGSGMDVELTGDGTYRTSGGGELERMVYDVPARVESLERRGVDLQLVSPPPGLISNPQRAASADLARLVNKSTAKLVAEGRGRLAGMAAVALGEPGLAAGELRRAVDAYGFRGAMISTTAAGQPLDGAEFEPVFAAFEELGLVVFMHPTSATWRAAQRDYSLEILVGYPHETTLSVSRLIFAGVFERHPRLKLILAHGGGTLPYVRGRLNLGYTAPRYEHNPACSMHISRKPADYLEQLYFDTCVTTPESLHFLVDVVSAGRVVFGTDFPYEVGDADGAIALSAIEAMAVEVQAKILSGNVRAMLGL